MAGPPNDNLTVNPPSRWKRPILGTGRAKPIDAEPRWSRVRRAASYYSGAPLPVKEITQAEAAAINAGKAKPSKFYTYKVIPDAPAKPEGILPDSTTATPAPEMPPKPEARTKPKAKPFEKSNKGNTRAETVPAKAGETPIPVEDPKAPSRSAQQLKMDAIAEDAFGHETSTLLQQKATRQAGLEAAFNKGTDGIRGVEKSTGISDLGIKGILTEAKTRALNASKSAMEAVIAPIDRVSASVAKLSEAPGILGGSMRAGARVSNVAGRLLSSPVANLGIHTATGIPIVRGIMDEARRAGEGFPPTEQDLEAARHASPLLPKLSSLAPDKLIGPEPDPEPNSVLGQGVNQALNAAMGTTWGLAGVAPKVVEVGAQAYNARKARLAAEAEKAGQEAKYGTIEKATATRHAKEDERDRADLEELEGLTSAFKNKGF